MTVRLAIAGAGGRMGRTLIEACAGLHSVALHAAIEHPEHAALGMDAGTLAGVGANGVFIGQDLTACADEFDVVVEFTLPEPTLEHVEQCVTLGKGIVIGTTGLDAAQRATVAQAGRRIPVVLAPNMSVGVNLTFKLIELAAQVLGDDADVEVLEAHHRHKVDAPSGTAVHIGRILADTLGRDLDTCAVHGRQGHTGARDRQSIGFQSIRGGDIVGDHTVLFALDGERIEITHRSHTRANFAHGALRAAQWLAGREPGFYDMRDVLGLR